MCLPGLTILEQYHVLCVVCSTSKNILFTCSPTIYLGTSLACPNHLPVRTAGAGGEDLAGPWGDVIYGGQEAGTQSSFHQGAAMVIISR